jgi:FlaA1/EpsC-like NDP-sugar epimerase
MLRRLLQTLGLRGSPSRNRYFFLLDALLLPLGTPIGYCIRFEGWSWLATDSAIALTFLLFVVPLKLWVLWSAGLYRRLWRYASIADLERILLGGAASVLGGVLLGALVLPLSHLTPRRVPLAVLFIDGCITVAVIALPRLLVRVRARWKVVRPVGSVGRVLVVGAGDAGGIIAKEMLGNPELGLVPVAFLDDDVAKHNLKLHSVPVVGALDALPAVVKRLAIDEVIIAMPRASGRVVRDVVRAASEVGVPTRTVPGIFELISGRKSVSALRSVEIQDLLRREPIVTDMRRVRSLATGETVLVTGAGGSIGSELCRQLATLEPSRIVVLGRGENSIFELVQELSGNFPCLEIEPVIADVRDCARLEAAFRRFSPYSVFHAAAHKHVPLMEHNVAEAIVNNVLGTKNVALLAARYGAEHFVLISTDKAVRPTSIMGATKRVAEGVVHEVASRTGKRFVSVRFGNVLGSRGSVVPTFLRQIAAGGPVTVTHPEMRRYFMTIPEAVQLVLQAGAMGRGQETFVLDMGEAVKIADLAADLIRLSGLEVGSDVEIRFTGCRPGEKLYEELFFDSEIAAPTSHPKVLRGPSAEFPTGIDVTADDVISAALGDAPPEELRAMLGTLVPDYEPLDIAEPAMPARAAHAMPLRPPGRAAAAR